MGPIVMPQLPKAGEQWKWGDHPAFVVSHDWTYAEYHREMQRGGKADGDPVFRRTLGTEEMREFGSDCDEPTRTATEWSLPTTAMYHHPDGTRNGAVLLALAALDREPSADLGEGEG